MNLGHFKEPHGGEVIVGIGKRAISNVNPSTNGRPQNFGTKSNRLGPNKPWIPKLGVFVGTAAHN